MGEPVRAFVQLRVGEGRVRRDHREGVLCPFCSCLEQLRHGPGDRLRAAADEQCELAYRRILRRHRQRRDRGRDVTCGRHGDGGQSAREQAGRTGICERLGDV